jgi:hypothetical protein
MAAKQICQNCVFNGRCAHAIRVAEACQFRQQRENVRIAERQSVGWSIVEKGVRRVFSATVKS